MILIIRDHFFPSGALVIHWLRQHTGKNIKNMNDLSSKHLNQKAEFLNIKASFSTALLIFFPIAFTVI